MVVVVVAVVTVVTVVTVGRTNIKPLLLESMVFASLDVHTPVDYVMFPSVVLSLVIVGAVAAVVIVVTLVTVMDSRLVIT